MLENVFLLLMGPVSGGKSTLVTMLKRGLETYSRRTDRGAILQLKGCPMHERSTSFNSASFTR